MGINACTDARVDEADRWGVTPLIAATFAGHTRLVNIFLRHNADVNFDPVSHVMEVFPNADLTLLSQQQGRPCLWTAAWRGYPEISMSAIENGANVNYRYIILLFLH